MNEDNKVLYIVNSAPPYKEVYIQSDETYCTYENDKWNTTDWEGDNHDVFDLYEWVDQEPNNKIHKRIVSYELITIEELFEKEPELFALFL